MTKPRIGIVEDEYLIALCFEDFLNDEGYDVKGIFPSAEKLLHYLKDDALDLVLMDLNLAGPMDGLEATRAILKNSQIPVLILTGYRDEKTHAKALAAGATNVLSKPVGNLQLAQAVRSALAPSTAEN